jgi:hypothetical protein
VKHNVIYNSFDCNTKLSWNIFSNSKAGNKLSCGRTKAESLVTNVLAPLSITNFSKTL